LVGGGLRNSSDTVFTKLCTEIQGKALVHRLTMKIALVFILTDSMVFYEVIMPFRILGGISLKGRLVILKQTFKVRIIYMAQEIS